MRRLIICMLIFSLIAFAVFPSSVSASSARIDNAASRSQEVARYPELFAAKPDLRNSVFISVSTYFTIGDFGVMDCAATVNCTSAISRIHLFLYLDYQYNGVWSALAQDDQATSGRTAFIARQWRSSTPGLYRVRISAYAWDGTLWHHTERTSNPQVYE